MAAVARKTFRFWAAAFVLVFVAVVALAVRFAPTVSARARARHDIALGKPSYYYVAGVANAPPPPLAESLRARSVTLINNGCIPLTDEQTAYNEAIAEHYR